MPEGMVCCPGGKKFCNSGETCLADGGCLSAASSSTSAGEPMAYGGNGGHVGGVCPGYGNDGSFSDKGTCDSDQFCCPRNGLDPSGNSGYCCGLNLTCCPNECSTDPTCGAGAVASSNGGSKGGCALDAGQGSSPGSTLAAWGTALMGLAVARSWRRRARATRK
jgi:hypothetical protein